METTFFKEDLTERVYEIKLRKEICFLPGLIRRKASLPRWYGKTK
jgi:hypothetical protein